MNAPVDVTNICIETERLILRPWKESDLDDFYEYASVDGVGQMAGWLPHENKEVSMQILQKFIEGKKTFAIEYQGKVIGSLGIEKYSEEELPEFAKVNARIIGFVLSKDYWGMGLMPEAVKAVIRYLFEEEKLDVIFCAHYEWNLQSARVQEKCGFSFYKEVTHKTTFQTEEKSVMNILRQEEWRNMHD